MSKRIAIGTAALAAALVVSGCADDETTPASLRVAHLSATAPAVDFCIAPHGSGSFSGPIMKSLGETAGLAYGEVTKYLSVSAIQYDVRLVAPNAANCSTSLAELPDFTGLPALPADGNATVAAIGLLGDATYPFQLKAYIDEAAAPTGKIKLRFVHDSPGTPAVDVGLGTGTGFVPLFVNVSYPNITAAGGAIDANGYLTADPINASVANPVLITARVNPAGPEALNIPLTFPAPAGTVATAFATGLLASTATPLQVLLCLDNAPPTGNLSTCILAP